MTEFVETYDEPHHRRRFENAFVRTYDALIPAGVKTLYHRHTEDTFYVSIYAAKTQEQELGCEPGAVVDVPAGVALCRPHRTEPLTHQVTNHGDGDMRMIGAEVRTTPKVVAKDPLDVPCHTLQWQRDRLRAYRITVAPGETTGNIEYGFGSVTVVLGEASLLVRSRGASEATMTRQAGDILWQDGPASFSMRNVGERPFEAYLAEWC